LSLVAHLCGDFGVARGFGDHTSFVDVVCEGFFAVDVFAELDRGHGDDGVLVVGCGDDDGVDVFLFVEHLAVVAVALGVGVGVVDACGVGVVDVAEGDDVFAGALADIACASAADADAGDVEFFVGGYGAACGGEFGGAHGSGGSHQEVAT